MKKIMLILSLFGLFVFTSCDTPDTNATTNSNPSTTETNPSDSAPSNTEEEPDDESSTNKTNDKDSDSTLPDYDDGGDWHGTID